ncbi:hypothetical protein K438DRAFT_1981191 [Mycena galopus ATCC 62051]|nr:hypothetical protein K438DRAFT_1981191 [Mycena galopus ATCC 62051]
MSSVSERSREPALGLSRMVRPKRPASHFWWRISLLVTRMSALPAVSVAVVRRCCRSERELKLVLEWNVVERSETTPAVLAPAAKAFCVLVYRCLCLFAPVPATSPHPNPNPSRSNHPRPFSNNRPAADDIKTRGSSCGSI